MLSRSGSERDAVLGPNLPAPGGWSLDRAHKMSGPRRTMPHMSRKEWYEMYLHREPQPAGGTKASQRTFERMYRGWKKHLRIAKRIQMGKCVTCERIKAIRRQSLLPEHKEEAAQSQRLHVEVVLRDRRADNLIQGMAEESLMVADTAVRWDRTIFKFRCGLDGSGKIPCAPQRFYEQTIFRHVATPARSRWNHYGWYWVVRVSHRRRPGEEC